tara:strand:+ start:2932 stop:3498 length:567 start_codon:yes stop_codon:yes gene_type:complete
MLLHERLRQLRDERSQTTHTTQKDIATLFGISSSLITHMESGARVPTFSQLKKLIEFYDVNKKIELELKKAWFIARLPEDVFECHQDISNLVSSEMSQIEIDDYVSEKRGEDGSHNIYKSEGLSKMINFLKQMEPERRDQDISAFVSLARLPLQKSVIINKIICNLVSEPDEELLDRIYTVVQTFSKK